MNKDMAQFELDDEALDSVNGGVTANQVSNCEYCNRIDTEGAPSCSNCTGYRGGRCPHLN